MHNALDFFDLISRHLAEGLPLVAYREPESFGTVKALLQSDSVVHKISDFSESGFVFAPFDDSRDAILLPSLNCKEIQGRVDEMEESGLGGKRGISPEHSVEKERHLQLVQKAMEDIGKGKLKKVVLSRAETQNLQNSDAVSIFKRLLNTYSTAFIYIWFHPKIGLWLGATPETLLQVERNRFKTMALAGTQKFEGSIEVSWGEKEREEQQFVTDAILDNLKGITSSTNIIGPYSTKAGNLLHLRTDISGILPGDSSTPNKKLQQLISAIHPTPAICGLPRESAKTFILENENYDREFYTGFLGELNMKKNIQRSVNRRNTENLAYGSMLIYTSLYVNLRCMKVEGNHALVYVGGGITKDSIPANEWEETQNKAGTMKAVLIN